MSEGKSVSEGPLVMCVTNVVASEFTANCLLAVGARPAMMEEPCEAEELAPSARAVLINVGTVTAAQAETMRAAVRACRAHGVPWVLDPVAAHLIGYRRALVREFLADEPAVVRGNHGEIDGLGLSARPGVTLSTGERDRIWCDCRLVEEISGGVAMLQRVTATGCAQGALVAACLGRGMGALEAARTASHLVKKAGERAFGRARATGSFRTAFVDALWELTNA